MKRIILAILSLLLLAACATQDKSLSYKSPGEKPLTLNKIYLEVKDVRQDKEVLSPRVKEMKIWSGTGSVINLFQRAAKRAEGDSASQQPPDIKMDFKDAMSLRLSNLGVSVIPLASDEGTSMILEVERVRLDLKDSKFFADVMYLAKVFRDGKIFHQERITGRAEKYNLLGQKTGQEVLSEAFSLAINNLDVKAFLGK
ncbi:MAG: hypothetical protein JRI34_02130 [Deltaproteobacteria bacterium]|nr:hypothetical protein [Deltaproteobacteria bacterium]